MNNTKIFCLVFFLFQMVFAQNEFYTLKGIVKDPATGEEVIGAQIYIKDNTNKKNSKGLITDAMGAYTLSLPKGEYTLTVSYLSYSKIEKKISLNADQTLDIELIPLEIAEIIIEDRSKSQVQNTEIGVVKIDIKSLETLPVIFGEKDIMKSMQLLPGISGQEGSGGFFVRGGNPDHNLVLLDGIPVFNTSHQNGLVSVFQSDALQDAKVSKAGLPVQYGGRLASVTDISTKEGNKDKLHGEAGLGLLSSYATLDGPITGTPHTWLFSTRISYFGIFPALILDFPIKLYFADVLGKITFELGKKDKLSVLFYTGGDNIGIDAFIDLYFYNGIGAVKWKHTYSEQLTGQLTFGISNYASWFNLAPGDGINFLVTSGITDYLLRKEFFYQINYALFLTAGLDGTFRITRPGTFQPKKGADSSVPFYKVNDKNSIETGVFAGLDYKIMSWLSTYFGFRYSFYTRIGKDQVYTFNNNQNVIATTYYKKGEAFGFYSNFEPRVLFNFIITKNNSIKLSYEREAQYIQLIQSNPTGQPTDYWFPAGGNIKPQTSEQYSIGFFNNFFNNIFETSVEFYYKNLYNQIDYIDGASTLLNEQIEGQMTFGKGRAYGMEILLKKNLGKWNGWIGYTLAASRRTFPEINQGKEFSAIQDRTHDLSLVLTYTPSPRHIISGVFVYYTGSAATYPTAMYQFEGSSALYFSNRNAYRLPDYHRLDLAYTYKWKKYAKYPNLQISNTYSVYNAYYQKNPYSVSFRQDENNPEKIEIIQQSLFTILPSVSFNFSF